MKILFKRIFCKIIYSSYKLAILFQATTKLTYCLPAVSTGDQASPEWDATQNNLPTDLPTVHDTRHEHTVQTLTEYEQEAGGKGQESIYDPEDEEEEESATDYHVGVPVKYLLVLIKYLFNSIILVLSSCRP